MTGASSKHSADVEAQLREANETLDAIRNGEVDAIVVGGPNGQQIYTLQNADRPYRLLIEQMQEGALTLSTDGVILYCNEMFAKLSGTDRQSIVGRIVTDFLPSLSDADLKGKGHSSERDLIASSGAQVPVNVSLAPVLADNEAPAILCGVVTDLTVHRKRSDELAAEIQDRRRAEDSLQLALDAAGMGTWDLDLASGCARCSPRYEEIFGETQPAGIWSLQNTLERFLPSDRLAVRKAFVEAQSGTPLEFLKRIRRASDESIRWLHVKGRTYYDGDKPLRLAGVVSDITDQRATEDQLRQAQKMEAVGQLTGGIAHDFNNLLAGISGSLELIERRISAGRYSGLERYIVGARSSASRAAALTQRLLAFSRRQTLDPKPTNINRLVAGMEELIRRTVGPSIELEVVGAGGIWTTKVDPAQLESALLNLCINARDAMPNGGRITIETANKWLDERAARERDLPPGQYVSLCVTDTGTGMPPDVIAQAFDPFFTTKPLGQGTGLGLSMIHGFARQSGGQVRVSSEIDKGTTMCLYFPRATGDTADPASTEVDAFSDTGQGETILVIDDEPTVRMLMVEVLQEAGYTVVDAGDGPTGLKFLQSKARIDLLITDVGLPGGMNGRQVADAARINRPDLKVLFVTGYAENAAIGNGLLDAGMQVIAKPFAMTEFANKVRELIDAHSK